MAAPTPTNVTGIEDFDSGPVGRLPEYQAVGEALDQLVKAIASAQIELDQAAFLALAAQVASSLSYKDRCSGCGTARFPAAASVTPTTDTDPDASDGVRGAYHCPSCGNTWTCGWAANVSDWI